MLRTVKLVARRFFNNQKVKEVKQATTLHVFPGSPLHHDMYCPCGEKWVKRH